VFLCDEVLHIYDVIDEPPPQVVDIMEMVVGAILREGPEYEADLRRRRQGNPDFAFLDPTNAHHGYFRTWIDII
jgi:hypothetical protein